MANRYWVGGTAGWDNNAGTKWATTSGGLGGAAVPTAADDVFFDGGSGASTVSISGLSCVAKSINCTGFTGTISGLFDITVSGSVTLVAGMTVTWTGRFIFNATATLISAGKSLGGITVNGNAITVTLGDALTINQQNGITLTLGTLNTANYNVTSTVIQATGSGAKTLTLGSSTVTLSGATATNEIEIGASANLTLNANTSQINLSAADAVINAPGLTFRNVSFTSTTAGTRLITGSGTNTFNNLTLTASASGLSVLSIGTALTVNGTLTCAGTSFSQRGFLKSTVAGTTRTLTVATLSAADCDFRDITIAGAAAGGSPTRAGNCGGNSGLTFPGAKTVYRVGTNTTWAGSSSWATGSGGSGADTNFPLAQDTAVIDNSTTLSGTLTVGGYNLPAISASTRTNAITFNHSVIADLYGSYTLGSGVTVSGIANQTFAGRGTMDFTSAGKTITFPILVDAGSGTFRLLDALNSTGAANVVSGTFNANNFNVTVTAWTSNNSNTRTITMGSGTWTLSGTGAVWTTTTTTNLTFNRDTANITLSDTSTTARTFAGGGLTFNDITVGGATGTSATTFNGAMSASAFRTTKTVAHTITFSSNLGTITTWAISGSPGAVVTINSSANGTRRTFTLTNVTQNINFMSIRDLGITNNNRFYAGVNSTNVSNNNNVIFLAGPNDNSGGFLMFM